LNDLLLHTEKRLNDKTMNHFVELRKAPCGSNSVLIQPLITMMRSMIKRACFRKVSCDAMASGAGLPELRKKRGKLSF